MPKIAPKKPVRQQEEFPKEQYLAWYELMLLLRRFEERAQQLYIQQKIRGFCHLYTGQEAIAAGAASTIKPEDNIITAYRDHTIPIAKGLEPKYVMAELFARSTGCSKGKGGSMHIFDIKNRFFGGHGIVGCQIPLGAGIAFAEKYRHSKHVTLCFMGDGAVRQGAFHETMNMAMMWKLPVVFIIENNNYAMGTSVERSGSVSELYELSSAYNMPSLQADGMRCEAVHKVLSDAVRAAREGKGPALIELKTYRYRGHSMSDPANYRTKTEVEKYKALDCIDHTLTILKKNDWISDAEIQLIEIKIKEKIDEAVKFADESPYPELDELYKDVYMQKDYPFITD